MEQRVRETLVNLFGNAVMWGTILVVAVWLCSCEYGPDTLDLSYGRGMGESSLNGFEPVVETESDYFGLNIGWFLTPRDFRVVGHELDANRDAIPIYQSNEPPVVVHDHSGDVSTGEQVGGVIEDLDKADPDTLLFIVAILALFFGVAAVGAAIYFLLKQRGKPNSKQA